MELWMHCTALGDLLWLLWNPAHIMKTKPDDLERAWKSVATTHIMMMDVIPILTIMSLALKKEQVDISSVQAIVVSTNRKQLLKARMANSCLRFYQAKKSNGKITQLKSTQMKSSSLNQWVKFLYNILLNLPQRFPGESTDVVKGTWSTKNHCAPLLMF